MLTLGHAHQGTESSTYINKSIHTYEAFHPGYEIEDRSGCTTKNGPFRYDLRIHVDDTGNVSNSELYSLSEFSSLVLREAVLNSGQLLSYF